MSLVASQRPTRRHAVVVAACAALTAASVTPSLAVTLQKIAISGDSAPGTGTPSWYTSFGLPAVNAAGTVAFSAGATSDPINPSTHITQGLWAGNPASPNLLVSAATTPNPATPDLTFESFPKVFLNDAGQIAFQADATNSSSIEISTLWTNRSGPLQLVARKDQLPGGTPGIYPPKGFDSLLMDGSGRIAFATRLFDSTASKAADFFFDGSSTVNIAQELAPAPSPLTQYQSLYTDSLRLNHAGTLLYSGTATPYPASPDRTSVFLRQPTGDTQVLSTGSVTASASLTLNRGPLNGINDAGDLIYDGLVFTPTASPTGLVVKNAAGYHIVATTGTPAPGTPAGWTFANAGGFLTQNYLLLHSGDVAFSAAAQDTSFNSKSGLWLGHDAADLRLIAAQGDSAPGLASVTFFRFGALTADARGDLLFFASLAGASTGNSLWCLPAGAASPFLITRIGDTVDVDPSAAVDLRTISDISFNTGTNGEDGLPSSFASDGTLALSLTFTDQSRGIFLTAVPEPTCALAAVALLTSTLVRRRPRHC